MISDAGTGKSQDALSVCALFVVCVCVGEPSAPSLHAAGHKFFAGGAHMLIFARGEQNEMTVQKSERPPHRDHGVCPRMRRRMLPGSRYDDKSPAAAERVAALDAALDNGGDLWQFGTQTLKAFSIQFRLLSCAGGYAREARRSASLRHRRSRALYPCRGVSVCVWPIRNYTIR